MNRQLTEQNLKLQAKSFSMNNFLSSDKDISYYIQVSQMLKYTGREISLFGTENFSYWLEQMQDHRVHFQWLRSQGGLWDRMKDLLHVLQHGVGFLWSLVSHHRIIIEYGVMIKSFSNNSRFLEKYHQKSPILLIWTETSVV